MSEAGPGPAPTEGVGVEGESEGEGAATGGAVQDGGGSRLSEEAGELPDEVFLPVYVGIVNAALSGASPGQLDPAVLEGLDVPDVCQQRGRLVSTARIEGFARATWAVPGELPEVAASVLEQLRDEGLDLRFGSYLDLLNQAWGGVVLSEQGWAEIVMVDAREGEDPDGEGEGAGTCLVSIIRIDQAIASGLLLEGGTP